MWGSPLLYERLTWPEVRRAVAEDRVCLIPVATLEDHGPHLPLDTDLRLTAEIARRAAEAAPEEIVLLPPVPHGYSPHHMDFPMDWADGPLKIMPWWSSFSTTGVQGDATKATAEKGRALLDAAVVECVAYVRELRAKPLPVRRRPRGTLS